MLDKIFLRLFRIWHSDDCKEKFDQRPSQLLCSSLILGLRPAKRSFEFGLIKRLKFLLAVIHVINYFSEAFEMLIWRCISLRYSYCCCV